MTSSADISDTRSIISVPPPYTEHPANELLTQAPRYSVATPTSARASAVAPSSSSVPAQSPAASSPAAAASDSSRPSLLARYRDARNAKAAKKAQRKVDFYERYYGCVPRNVMTNEEWENARKRTPVEKKKTSWGSRTYGGLSSRLLES
jgi:hypothetical protein